MNRREFLATSAAGAVALAGCSTPVRSPFFVIDLKEAETVTVGRISIDAITAWSPFAGRIKVYLGGTPIWRVDIEPCRRFALVGDANNPVIANHTTGLWFWVWPENYRDLLRVDEVQVRVYGEER